jgi:hypothetical protein
VINIQAPTALPDPTGLAAVLGALGTKNLFNDLSGAEATLKLAQALQKVGAAGATSGGALAAQTLKTVMEQNTERLRTAAKVAAAMAGVPPTGAVGGDAKKGDAKAPNTVAGGLENRAKEIDQSKQKSEVQGGTSRPVATELQQRQSGATAADTAAKIVGAVTQGTQTSESGAVAKAPTAAAPRRLTLELRGAQALRDAALFDNLPVTLQLQVKERDGTLIASRSGIDGGSSVTLPLASSSPSLFAEVSMVVQGSWPTPQPLVHSRVATIDLARVKSTLRLDLVLQFQQQQQLIAAGPAAPSDAKLVEVLTLVAFDLRTIFKKPVVEPNAAGEFIARFAQMAAMRVDFIPD